MRKIILCMNTSVDGIVSDELSWMKPDTDQSWNSFFNMLTEVDLLLLGSGMWQDYSNYWKKAVQQTGFTANEIKYAQYAANTRHVIFSAVLPETGWANAVTERGELKPYMQQLKSESGKNIQIVGGGKFASSCINTGLVDEYRIMINPVLVGKGSSLYSNLVARHELECFKVETLDNGVIILSYRQLT
jgi:dihydrofolate reductase